MSEGLEYAAIRYCVAEKVTPETRIAGQISIMAPKPAKAQMSQNGIRRSKGTRMVAVVRVRE